ncbi:mediator of RNA polymerase II transcription subunit 1-like [Centropristis striata]|uniref:mediator of RNA polymerase II transcription subunit 1-like n=1 Tax=Centropristis striata TaxID=184440 RepID=UPI0027DEBB1B|nr:mediator of RNA polymerase II transcription subunit 1-like [Centropristis striata]XP_059182727.1 mediator of RNA polymerase II transcription subunit 1-like [Centropristis striata]XP_059182728.1 mediator of RNA polymerase II transcription subunit 1-like [Centropristis striata]
MKSIISELHLKFAEKTWNETFQLVRRCMDKPKDESIPCKLLVRSLERLQEVFNVSSMKTMRSRLEVIAKQQGMGFHITEATCYLTADLFYLEVVLLPCGGVEEVKVAPHGGSPAPSECFLQLLRSKHFAEFSMKLAGLFTQYNVPGDNEVKLKLLASLQCLVKDLEQISHLPRVPKDSDPQVDMINNGRIGHLITGKEDCPLSIQFYIPPSDEIKPTDLQTTDAETFIQAAQVTVGDSDVTHKLQMASVIPLPAQLDPQGQPVFLPVSEATHETLPACFLLRLQPAIPVMSSFVNKLSQITDVAIPDVDLQWAPLPKLLMRRSSAHSHRETLDEQDAISTVPLPGGVMHSYILPGAAWEAPAQRGTVVDRVPFTLPAHVPALLELLRHQCVINALLTSCVAAPQCARTGSACDRHFEVLPESESSFSVTFHRPDTDSLAVLLVNVPDPHQITCTLFGAGIGNASMDEHLSAVMQRSMSVPVTMRTLYSKLEELTSAPLSPSRPAATKAENDHSSPSSTAATDTNGASTMIPQSSAVPEDGFSVSGSACYGMSVAKSELLPEINTSPAVNPYPFPAVGVFSNWMSSNGQLSELI